MGDIERTGRVRIFIGILLPACALALAAFYALLFQRDNAAPVVNLTGFNIDGRDILYQMDKCWSNDKKLVVSGWVVRKGHGAARRSVRVVVVDDSGQPRAMKTTQIDREDVSGQVNHRLGDKIRYRNAGFSASLNLAAADPPIRPGALHITYDDGDRKVLLPIPCRAGHPR